MWPPVPPQANINVSVLSFRLLNNLVFTRLAQPVLQRLASGQRNGQRDERMLLYVARL